jgi:hypothetical protein
VRWVALLSGIALIGCAGMDIPHRVKLEKRIHTLGEAAASAASSQADAAALRAETSSIESDVDAAIR